jgi:hypothetical protein
MIRIRTQYLIRTRDQCDWDQGSEYEQGQCSECEQGQT